MRNYRDADRFSLPRDSAAYQTASVTNKRHTSPPTAQTMLHADAHCHIIDGWDGGTYALVAPSDAVDGDAGQVMLRGHASQTLQWANYNFHRNADLFYRSH